MASISGVKGDIPLVKKSYFKLLALGEGVAGDEFTLAIEGYPDLTYLCQTTQLPALARENIETFGPHGIQFNQQGKYKNAQEIPISFKEVITGVAYKVLREWVREKKYLKVVLGLTGESMPTSSASNTVVLEDCWIEIDGVDLSVEDGGTLIKPSGTLHANWVGWLDDETETVSM